MAWKRTNIPHSQVEEFLGMGTTEPKEVMAIYPTAYKWVETPTGKGLVVAKVDVFWYEFVDPEEADPDPFETPEPETVEQVPVEEEKAIEEKREQMEKENLPRLQAKRIDPVKMKEAGVKPIIDLLQQDMTAFFREDRGKARAWLLSEYPGLDPSKPLLPQLDREDMITCRTVLSDPKRMEAPFRKLRYSYRALSARILSLKPETRLTVLNGQEPLATLRTLCSTLQDNLASVGAEHLSDDEIGPFFDAERIDDNGQGTV